MSRRPPRLTPALAVAALTVFLAGCFSIESTFTVHDDATADVRFLVLVDSERLEQLSGMFGEDADALGGLSGEALLGEMMGGDDPCGDLEGDLAEYDVSKREINDDGKVGVECTVSNVPLTEINSSMGSDGDSSFRIEQDDTGTRFTATLEGVDDLAGDGGDMGAMEDMLGLGFDDLFSIVFNVSAPGSLAAHNATSTSGSTASWKITPDAGFVTDGDAEMHAEWTPGGGSSSGSSALWIVLGIIAALAVIGLILFLIKRNKKGDATPDGTPSDGPPLAAPGAPGAPVGPPASATPPSPPPPPPPPPATDVPPPPPMAPPTPPST